jgi:gliding motility-associated-like protein
MKAIKNIFFVLLLCAAAFSACSKSDEEPEAITVPNAFTPNADNLNDTFKVVGRNISKYEIKIYDQNNLLVYNSKNIKEGWDGTFNGKAMPAGTYTYLIEYEETGGAKYKKTGSLELIRN